MKLTHNYRRDLLFGFGIAIAIGGLAVILGSHFVWILTDAEYAKHSDSAYALVQSIKYVWWAYIMMAVGGLITWKLWE